MRTKAKSAGVKRTREANEQMDAFPDLTTAQASQRKRLDQASRQLRKESSYRKIRDWFLASNLFIQARDRLADWLQTEMGSADRLPGEIAQHLLAQGTLAEIATELTGTLAPRLTDDRVVDLAADRIAEYVESRMQDPGLLEQICQQVEEKAGTAGWMAHVIGVIDTRVLTHDIADAIRAYAVDLRGPEKKQVKALLQTLSEEAASYKFSDFSLQDEVRQMLAEALAQGGCRLAEWMRAFDGDTIPPWMDQCAFAVYQQGIQGAFRLAESLMLPGTDTSELSSLAALVSSILGEKPAA